MQQNVNNVNQLRLSIFKFLAIKKLKVISLSKIKIGNSKIFVNFEKIMFLVISELLDSDFTQANEVRVFVIEYCESLITELNFDQGLPDSSEFFTSADAKERFNQVFFCESLRSKGYILTPTGNNDFSLSSDTYSVDIFSKELIRLSNKDYDAYKDWSSKRLIVGKYDYEPWGKLLQRDDAKVYVLNTYVEPKWVKKPSYDISWEQLNPEMRCFYEQMIPDPIQRHWVLNWMACSLQISKKQHGKKRLTTYLTLIGASGIGKGIICMHLQYLHGINNWYTAKIKKIGDKFSASSYTKKTMIIFDEANLGSVDEYNEVKKLESSYQDVEYKGQTASIVRVYWNIVWSCNNRDRMKYLDPDDRRFSICDLTNESLPNKIVYDTVTNTEVKFTRKVIHKVQNDEEMIDQLIQFFLGFKVDFDLAETPIKETKNYKEIVKESRPEWFLDFLNKCYNVDWENPYGNERKVGYQEILHVSEKHYGYYTYRIPGEIIERIREGLKGRSIAGAPGWSKLTAQFNLLGMTEFRQVRSSALTMNIDVYVRHENHDVIREKMSTLQLENGKISDVLLNSEKA